MMAREETRIFIVEDDAAILDVMRFILSDAGYMALLFDEQKDLIQQILAAKPQIILIDIHYKGRSLEKMIRTFIQSKKHNASIIVVSADQDILSISKKVQATDYLKKPFTIEEFLEKIKKYIIDEQIS